MELLGFNKVSVKTAETYIDNSFLLSGHEFYKLSNHSFCNRYDENLIVHTIREDDIIFLNLDLFEDFIKIMHNVSIPKCVIITHNSDLSFTDKHACALQQFAHKIYAINTTCNSPIVTTIPIGFRDDRYASHSYFTRLLQDIPTKDILVYMNFTIETNSSIRTNCFNALKSHEWVFKDNSIPREEFYNKLKRSKYVVSPEGTGIDCHRIYESIYFNAVPLLKTSKLDMFYQKLPVVLFEKWEDITEEYLVKNYDNYKSKLDLWKDNNKQWYTAKFWLK
jgi:hypothetical protein